MIPRDICAPLCLYLEIHPIWAEGDFEPWQCDNPGAELLLRQSKTRHHIGGRKKGEKKKATTQGQHLQSVSLRLPLGGEVRVRAWDSLRKKLRQARYTLERCSFCRLPRSKFSWIKAQCGSVTVQRMPRIIRRCETESLDWISWTRSKATVNFKCQKTILGCLSNWLNVFRNEMSLLMYLWTQIQLFVVYAEFYMIMWSHSLDKRTYQWHWLVK